MHARIFVVAVALSLATPTVAPAASPDGTLESARTVLAEIMSIPAKRIPHKMLTDAEAVAIVPGVIKIGFVAGLRRGRGVVLVKDSEGDWGLPQFITLTGGSVGWQAGAQATDVVLVFRTKKSVEGLLRGKFTIGADAAASAGPVGRNFEAATDAQLKAEILSYSRSRGLFAGVSLDGSALQVDEPAHLACYGTPSTQPPAQVPESATRLVTALAELSGPTDKAFDPQPTPAEPPFGGQPGTGQPGIAPPAAKGADQVRQDLAAASQRLQPLLDDNWRRYLAMPAEVYNAGRHAEVASVRGVISHFDTVAKNPQYQALWGRPEFQAVHGLLRQYAGALEATGELQLPPPPPVQSVGPALQR